MCGIGGIFEKNKNNKKKIIEILNLIKHRGPDHTGVWCDKNISLGNVRLKVIEFSDNSNQPFESSNKNFVMVFNGEIYNHFYLKKKYNLKTKTDSDTEVIIELFSKIGTRTFNLLDGMFAIAIYDKKRGQLYLARDHYGIKPLYYSLKNKQFTFSSEIKGILQNKKFIQNDSSIIDFLKWGGLDHSNKTWFKDIYNLKPATYILINRNFKIQEFKYYCLAESIRDKKINYENIPLQFKDLLEKSVKLQSNTVRTIGTNLSGGVDSSIVTLFLSKFKKDINTYTFGYSEKDYDERIYAKTVADKLQLKNYESICSIKDVNDNFIDTLIMQDEPFTSFRQVSHHKLYSDYKLDGSTVILEASGGDEIGAGYAGFLWPFYLDELKDKSPKIAWKNLINNLKINKNDISYLHNFIISGIANQKNYGVCTSDGKKIIDENCILKDYENKNDLGAPFYERKLSNNLQNSQLIELYHTKLPRGLRYVDRASSSVGREARVPLLTKDLVEFCFAVPNEFKIREGELRWFMKMSVKHLKKKFVNLSNKRSIADPQKIWIKNDFKDLFLDVFKSKKFLNRGIFNKKEVLKCFNFFLNNQNVNSLGIFQIFITEIWFRLFIDNNSYKFKGAKLDEFIKETN